MIKKTIRKQIFDISETFVPYSFPAPLMVGVISTPQGLKLLKRKAIPRCDLIELRCDHLIEAGVELRQLHTIISQTTHKVLLTARNPSEGGVHDWSDRERSKVISTLLPLKSIEMVDIELATAKDDLKLVKSLKSLQIILSAHKFDKTPQDSELAEMLETMSAYKANFIKVACLCENTSDLGRLAVMQYLNNHLPLALMGMGSLAVLSRTLLPCIGSRLVYGYLDEPTAPGQPHIASISQILKRKIEI